LKKLAKEETFFLTCLRLFLKGGGVLPSEIRNEIRSCLEEGMDWHLILSWSHWHGVTPLIYHILKEIDWAGIPEEITEILERSFRINMARNLFLSSEIDRVFEALGKRGVISIPIKGIFLSEEVYPDISFRMITDIDLLIRREDLTRAEESLVELGYCRDSALREEFFPENCYTLHMEKGEKNGQKVCVELHWGLANRRDYSLPMESWWEKITSISNGGAMADDRSLVYDRSKVDKKSIIADRRNLQDGYSRNGIHRLRMRPEVTLIYLTINGHMSRYSFLKQLVDIAQVIKFYEQDMDWETVICTAYELGLLDNLIFALGLVQKMFDVPIAEALSHRSTSWKQKILQSLFTEERLIRGKIGQDLRQFLLLFLLHEKVIFHSIWKVMFSSRETVAYRYSLSPQSHCTYLYLSLNPFLSLYRLLRGSVVDCWAGKGIGK
jgi:hypothetical protein